MDLILVQWEMWGQVTYIQLLMMSVLVPGVNCFMFISGYFGIRLKREKVIRMFMQATFFYIVMAILRNWHIAPSVFGESLNLLYFILFLILCQ